MNYRDIIGYNKSNKSGVKKQSKPKKTVLDGVKQELNEWSHQPPSEKRWSKKFNGSEGLTEFEQQGGKDTIKEVGASQEYHKLRKNFEKTYKAYWDSVNDFQLALEKKGLKKQSMDIHRKYAKDVLGFHAWLRQSIRKLL